MKKKYSIVCLVPFIACIVLFPVTSRSQDLTEAQRQERCQNNKKRIADLEAQLQIINTDLSYSMTSLEMRNTKEGLVFVANFNNKKQVVGKEVLSTDVSWYRLNRYAALYNYKYEDCLFTAIGDKQVYQKTANECLSELERIIARKIDKAKSLNRSEILAKKNEIEKQLAAHRNNLIALRCNQSAGTLPNIAGTWTYTTQWVYVITQNGPKFTWSLAKINEKGEGTIVGNSVSAKWSGGSGSGSATGKIKLDANGRATQIDWSNGAVFKRN